MTCFLVVCIVVFVGRDPAQARRGHNMLDITDITNRTTAYEKAAGYAKCFDINTDRELYAEKYALAKAIADEINDEVREELRSIRAVIAENLNEFTWDPCAETATVMAELFTKYAATYELLV